MVINLLLLLLSAALASTESAYCNQNLTIIDLSNTTVAVKWDSESREGTSITYRVTYYTETNSNLNKHQVRTTINGLLLKGLMPATTYKINIVEISTTTSPVLSLPSTKLLCDTTFATQDQSRQHAVEGVRAHVFYPFINDNSIISATVVWKSLSETSDVSIEYYNISILTLYDVDIPSKDFNETFFNVSKYATFIKLHSFIEILDFPLSTNALYILQIQGVLESGEALPFSEPIKINTSYAKPAKELYALFTDGSSYLIQGDSQREGSFHTTSPIAIDKTRRIIYYNDDNNIKRIWLNNNEPPQIIFEGEGLGITVHSLAYDWVGEVLYIGGNKDEDSLVLLRVRISDGKWSIIYESTMSTPVEMTVNPFTGFLHFIAGTDIVRFNLRNNSSVVVNSTHVQTLAEDVSSNCLYFIKEGDNGRNNIVSINTITGLDNDNCSFVYRITKTVRPDSRIAADDTGIYLIARDNRNQDVEFPLTFYTFNNAIGTDVGFFGVDENQMLKYILTTSPGTQPIPRFKCLSPDLSDITNRPHITSYTVTDDSNEYISINLTWSKPELPDECYNSYFSLPPLTYRVFLNTKEGLETKLEEYENGKIFYDTSAVITGISKGIEYLVSVSAMNQYTTRSFNDLLKGPQLILQEQDTSSSARPSVSITSISASPTSIQITTPTNPGSSSTNAVLIGSIAGAGGGIALILGLVIVTGIILAVLIKRRNKKSIDLKPPPPPPPPSSGDLQPYAVPIDSLEEYRKNGGKLPPLPPKNYEVPSVSIGHMTDADESYSTVLPPKGSPATKSMSPIETETYSSPLSSPKHAKSKYTTIPCQPNPSYTKPVKTINTRNGVATLRPPNPYSQPISSKKTPPTSPSTSPTNSLGVPSPYSDPVSIRGTTPPKSSALSLNVTPSPYSEPVKTKRSPSSGNETDEDEYYEPIQPVRPASSTNVGHHYFTLNPTTARPSSYSPSGPLPPVPTNNNNNGSTEQPLYSEVGGVGDRKN